MIKVTNIERFATHDGPGIRTTVFLKGCPLHCPWCANPETQNLHPDLLYTKSKCTGCRTCENLCPSRAIAINQTGTFQYNKNLCTFCNTCTENCLSEALEFQGRDMSLEDIMEEVIKDRHYYEASGGGITISGGEPFVQTDGLIQILKELKAQGLNTAVETTGSYPLKRLQKAEPYIDHFLYDFKHLDDTILKAVTGGSGSQIKQNLQYLLAREPEKVNIRIPIIPGFNYDPELIKKTLKYLKSLGVKKIELLPYHTLGKAKYEKMGKTYLSGNEMLSETDLKEFHQYALQLGLNSHL